MDAIFVRIENEPVLVTTLVGALIDFAIVFGAPISPDQKTAAVVLVTALLAFIARSNVTPV